MKAIINSLKALILIACIITLSSSEGFGGKPQPSTNFQRYAAAGFSINGKGYIGTGLGYANAVYVMKDFWEYNPATDSWTQKADFGGTARMSAAGLSIGNYGYIGMGYGYPGGIGGVLKDFWQYNPVKNTWTKKTDFGGGERHSPVCFSLGTKGYFGTGWGNVFNGVTYDKKDFWQYDPSTDKWTQIANFGGSERQGAIGFSIGGKGYVGTGKQYIGSSNYTVEIFNDFWEFDPGTNLWTQKADFDGGARCYAVGFSIGTKGYIGTGSNDSNLKDFWEYEPVTDLWIQKADFGSTERMCATGFSIGTKGYIGTGWIATNTFLQDFWEYNQSTNVWTHKTDLGCKHQGGLKDDFAIAGTNQTGNETLIVYPNPSTSTFNFRLYLMSEESVNIKIFDMMGRLIHEYPSLSTDNVMTIGEDLNAGIYIAVVTQGEYRKTVKITKAN